MTEFVRYFVMQSKSALVIYAVANLLGLLLFLSSVLAIMHNAKLEERDYYDFGDSLNFILLGLPILGICLLLNLAWVVKALIDIFRCREYLSLVAAAVVLAVWVTSILIVRMTN